MTAYYNEIEPYAADWLENLIREGHIAHGVVDRRSIEDICPRDLDGFTQCHFFAGIGVWSYALCLAGWPDDRPVWTGSCPCQPFSAAGKGAGFDDERHLWPAWHHLIKECRPAVVFGEQVASRDAEPWLDLVQDDMEGMDYAFGAVPFPSAGVGAPHIRDRLYWAADSDKQSCRQRSAVDGGRDSRSNEEARPGFGSSKLLGRMADASGERCGRVDALLWRAGEGRRIAADQPETAGRRQACIMGNTERDGLRSGGRSSTDIADQSSYWSVCEWIDCADGKRRPVEPGTFPLAHGAPARVGRLRAYGNAINAEAAAAFVRSAA